MSRPDEGGEALLVLTTTSDDESARRLARVLVEEGLAACVTRSAVRSTYRWDGSEPGAVPKPVSARAICEDDEVLLVIKTARHRLATLERRLLELHPYSCPELVVVAPEHVESRYLAWLLDACSGDAAPER